MFLAAPTSPDERLRKVAEASRGFVYAISRTGVTGERQALSDGAQSLYPEQFDTLMGELRIIAPVLGRTLPLARVPARQGR